MQNARWIVLTVLIGAMIAGSGCQSGTKVTFVNQTQRTIDAEFFTQGGPNYDAHVRLLGIAPGKNKSVYKEFDPELLPADFSITIDGATPLTRTKIVRIGAEPPKKMRIDVRWEKYIEYVIEVTDDKGRAMKTR